MRQDIARAFGLRWSPDIGFFRYQANQEPRSAASDAAGGPANVETRQSVICVKVEPSDQKTVTQHPYCMWTRCEPDAWQRCRTAFRRSLPATRAPSMTATMGGNQPAVQRPAGWTVLAGPQYPFGYCISPYWESIGNSRPVWPQRDLGSHGPVPAQESSGSPARACNHAAQAARPSASYSS